MLPNSDYVLPIGDNVCAVGKGVPLARECAVGKGVLCVLGKGVCCVPLARECVYVHAGAWMSSLCLCVTHACILVLSIGDKCSHRWLVQSTAQRSSHSRRCE
eukprot:scpid2607/ scgid30984/ 